MGTYYINSPDVNLSFEVSAPTMRKAETLVSTFLRNNRIVRQGDLMEVRQRLIRNPSFPGEYRTDYKLDYDMIPDSSQVGPVEEGLPESFRDEDEYYPTTRVVPQTQPMQPTSEYWESPSPSMIPTKDPISVPTGPTEYLRPQTMAADVPVEDAVQMARRTPIGQASVQAIQRSIHPRVRA